MQPSPTGVRFLVVGLCIAMSMLLYLDRFAISPATDTMLRELALTKGQFGEAIGAFFLAYALMQIPSGWLTDTLGARWMLGLYVVCWSLATIGLGLAEGLAAIATMRLVLGIAQAGAYPAAASLIKRWVPYASRGLANSSVAMGGRCGLLLALAITVPLMHVVERSTGNDAGNWRVVFALYGSLGLVWAAAFFALYRNRPEEHPWCNAAEVELIESGPGTLTKLSAETQLRPSQAVAAPFCALLFVANIGWILLISRAPSYLLGNHREGLTALTGSEMRTEASVSLVPVVVGLVGTLLLCAAVNRLLVRFAPVAGRRLQLPLGAMLKSKEVWLMCLISFCVNIGWIFLATWLPQYLIESHGSYLRANIGEEALVAALITAVVSLAAMAGGLCGGRATDVFVRRFGPIWGRRLPGAVAGGLVCLMYLGVPQLRGLWPFAAAMVAIAFTIDFGLGAIWASYQDIGGQHVASVLGVGNMCGNLGAACFGLFIGFLADKDQWNTVFLISSAAMLVTVFGWLLFDPTRTVVRERGG